MEKFFKADGPRPDQKLSARRKRLKWGATVVAALLAVMPLKMSARCYRLVHALYHDGFVVTNYTGDYPAYVYYFNSDNITKKLTVNAAASFDWEGHDGTVIPGVKFMWGEAECILITSLDVTGVDECANDDNSILVPRTYIACLPEIPATTPPPQA
jgi:hypothetical protein